MAAKSVPPGDPSPRPPRRRRRWAEHELGELLGRAFGDETAGSPTPAEPATGRWEVEPLPSEADGGVVGLLLREATGAEPVGTESVGGEPGARQAGGPGPDEPLTEEWPADPHGPGRARLADMIEGLADQPTPRLTPDDVVVDDPSLPPPVVWFWGDDDIYPGKVPGVAQPVGVPRDRRPR